MNFIKEQWERLIDFLQDVPWLRVVVALLMIACSIQICLWIRDTVDTNTRLEIAVDTATKYAGELEKENVTIRKKMEEVTDANLYKRAKTFYESCRRSDTKNGTKS